MFQISFWRLDFIKNSINFDLFSNLDKLLLELERNEYEVGEKTSVYAYSEESNSIEFRANLYYGKVGIVKLVIFIDRENISKSTITIQKIKKVETNCIKIQSLCKDLELIWNQTFFNRKFLINNVGTDELIEKLQFLKKKILEYINNPFLTPNIQDCATFLEDLVKLNEANQAMFVSSDNQLDFEKARNIIDFMLRKNVFRIDGNTWYLTVKGDFFNGYVPKQFQYGNIFSTNQSYIFKNQDKFINPFIINSITYNPSKLDIASISYKNDFRLIGFEIFTGYLQNVKFELGSDKEPKAGEPFVTILIGSNGTGKTRGLSIIEAIFQDLNCLKKGKKSLGKIEYFVKYKIGNALHEITVKEEKKLFLINGEFVSIKEILLPRKLLACSFNVDDKFTYKSSNEIDDENVDEFYEYLGIKSASNAVHVGASSKKLALNIIRCKDNNLFFDKIYKIFDFLGLSSIFRLKFKIDDKLLTSVGINFNKISELIDKKNKDRKEIDKLIQEEDKNVYYDYLRKREKEFFTGKNDNINNLEFNYEINSEMELDNTLKEELDIVNILIKLKVLVTQGIEFKKKEFFRVELASSGENHMLFEMINILSNIKENSLILIDEPEISLHPNWQYKYVELLTKIFNDSSCHFIIATHSHFVLSDLKPESSSIISLIYDSDEGNIQDKLHDEKTFGWSAENILFNIFKVPSNRNYYLANELDKVLLMIRNGNVTEVEEKLSYLIDIQNNLLDSDPLKEVIKKIVKKVRNNE